MNLPDFVKRGRPARLIPVVSDTQKEQRAVSTLLSIMSAVPGLSDALLSPLGQGVTKRTVVNTFTEVELLNGEMAKGDRPDGLVQLVRGKNTWHALVEAKIGNAQLDAEQIQRYARLARENSVDAVITISNEFASRPTHHPAPISKQAFRRVDLFHLSWTHVLTEALLLQSSAQVTDPEQAFLLRELIRFLSHESVGVNGYTSMPSCWGDVVSTLQSGGSISKKDTNAEIIVAGWHQECRDLSLQLSQFLGRRVEIYLSRKAAKDPIVRVSEDVALLAKSGELNARLIVPDAAADIILVADLRARSIRVSMDLEAPRDLQRTSSRVNWLLRQIKDVDPDGVTIRLKWASRAANFDIPLSSVREDVKQVDSLQTQSELRAFEVILTSNSGQRFKGRKTFIEEIESICPRFYSLIGQNLKAWQAAPPKPKNYSGSVQTTQENSRDDKPAEANSVGNNHTELLEVPEFLIRLGATAAGNEWDNDDESKVSRPSRFAPHLLSGSRL